MLTFDPLGTRTSAQWQIHDNTTEPASSNDGTGPVASAAVHVTLSGAGLTRAAAESNNQDIEDSGLPDGVQQALKMIRALKKQLEEKRAELQAVMNDQHLDPQQRQARVAALQNAIAGLNAALVSANVSLAKAMKDLDLSPEQVLKAGTLATR